MPEQANLEQLVNAARERNARGPMSMPAISAENYERETFLKHYDQWEDLLQGKYVQAINENPNNLDAREDLCMAIFGDPNVHREMQPTDVIKLANDTYTQGIESLARYAQHNKDLFLDALDENALVKLVNGLPMYKSKDDDKEHDYLVGLLNEIRGLGKIASEKDEETRIGNMREVVIRGITKNEGLSDSGKALFAYLAQRDGIAKYFFERMVSGKQEEFGLRLSRYEGDKLVPDRAKYLSLLETSIEAAEDAATRKIKPKDQKKIWEKSIRPLYAAIAQEVYSAEKNDYNEENKTQEEKDMDTEKKEIKAAGIQM